MHEEPVPETDAELEARIVALLLGEASDYERAQLEERLRAEPALALVRDQLQAVHRLLEEIGEQEFDEPPTEWKLEASRRAALLSVLDGPASQAPSSTSLATRMGEPQETLAPAKSRAAEDWRRHLGSPRFLAFAGAACVLLFAGLLALPLTQRRLESSTDVALSSTPDLDFEEWLSFREDSADEVQSDDLNAPGLQNNGTPRDNLRQLGDLLSAEETMQESETAPMSRYYLYDDVQYFPTGPSSPPQSSINANGNAQPGEPTSGVTRSAPLDRLALQLPDAFPSAQPSSGLDDGIASGVFNGASGGMGGGGSGRGGRSGGGGGFGGGLGGASAAPGGQSTDAEGYGGEGSGADQIRRWGLPGQAGQDGAQVWVDEARGETEFAVPPLPSLPETGAAAPAGEPLQSRRSQIQQNSPARDKASSPALAEQPSVSAGAEPAPSDWVQLEKKRTAGQMGQAPSPAANSDFSASSLEGIVQQGLSVAEQRELAQVELKAIAPALQQSLAELGEEFYEAGRQTERDQAGYEADSDAPSAHNFGDSNGSQGAGQAMAGRWLRYRTETAATGEAPEEAELTDGASQADGFAAGIPAFGGFEGEAVAKELEPQPDAAARGVQPQAGTVVRELEEDIPQEIEMLARGREGKPAPTATFGRRARQAPAWEETSASRQPFSTFSLHVSDVSFKLAWDALLQGKWPEASQLRIEEFVNALDYHDPLPAPQESVACTMEQARHPGLQQRNLLRVAMRTAATGRAANVPLRLTLLLDNSGSMERPDRRETVRRAFATLIQQLRADDRVTLISFSRSARLLADQVDASQASELLQMLDSLTSEGGTNLEQAMLLAFEKAREQHMAGAQNRVVLLTDGAVNLGDANPQSLADLVTRMREAGIAFDAAGISARDLNDDVLEAMTRQGDGRYYLLDAAESASEGFAQQLAGALRPAAKNVKVQVEFNPRRVGNYKLLGFEKHRLKKEDFRNDAVDAAEMSAAEAGVAMYQFEPKPDGEGDVGSVSVRFQDMSTGSMVEHRWPIPYDPSVPRLEQASASMRLATAATWLAALLRGDALGESVDPQTVQNWLADLPAAVHAPRVGQLKNMIQLVRQMNSP